MDLQRLSKRHFLLTLLWSASADVGIVSPDKTHTLDPGDFAITYRSDLGKSLFGGSTYSKHFH